MADNLNISPDMINNLVNMLKSANSSNDSSNNPSDNPLNNHLNDSSIKDESFGINHTSQTNNSSDSSKSSTNIDFETIMKMKSIMESLNNSNDQDSQLLNSLKPYLRKSRQAKIDQYTNILKITQISKIFNSKK